jgi:hypothetical protein
VKKKFFFLDSLPLISSKISAELKLEGVAAQDCNGLYREQSQAD